MFKKLILWKIGLGLVLFMTSFVPTSEIIRINEFPNSRVAQNQASTIKVYLFLLDECRISQELMPELNEIYSTFGENVDFIGVFPNFSSKIENIAAFKTKYKVKFETTTDYTKKLCKQYDIQVLPEAVIVNGEDKILYKGAINNLYVSRGRRIKTTPQPYLINAIEEALSNPNETQEFHVAIGCAVNYSDKM